MSKITAKRVSNYELFYDLVFVYITSNLTSFVHENTVSWLSVLTFIIANFLFLTIWAAETLYLNKYGERDLLDILTIIASMFTIGNMGLNMSLDFKQYGFSFNIWLAVSCAIIFLQYTIRGQMIEQTKDFKAIKNLTLIITLWACVMTILCYFQLLSFNIWSNLLYLIPVFSHLLIRREIDHTTINFPHLVERYQLITIITFGESVIAIIKTYTSSLNGFLLFFGMASLFTLYITQTHHNVEHHQKIRTTTYVYAHLFIILGINCFTVGIESIVHPHHSELGYLFFVSGILLFYLGMILTSRYNQDLLRPDKKSLTLYTILLFVGLVLIYLIRKQTTLAFASFAVLGICLVFGLYYFREKNRKVNW